MNNQELLFALDHIEREKGIKKEILFQAIESALVSAARKIVGKNKDDITVSIDRTTGEIKVLSGKEEIVSGEFGRIAAQTAKQVIIQKIREAERDVVFQEYHDRIGTICTGSVHRFEKGNIVIDLGKAEAVLPKTEQNRKENYRQGDRIKAYILDVEKTSKGPGIVLSRTHPGLVKKLFEIEVPEITDGIVEIRAISREAGERTKIAVHSKDEKVDPVGACVGMRGTRVKDIVNELHGERIDIIRWNEDIREFVKSSLSPAEIAEIKINKDSGRIDVIVNDDQLSLAIGKHGQNVRLASKLVGHELDIKTKASALPAPKAEIKLEGKVEEHPPAETHILLTLDGVGEKTKKALEKAGYDSVEKLKNATLEDLLKIDGVGQKTAQKILDSAKKLS